LPLPGLRVAAAEELQQQEHAELEMLEGIVM
jgi:hypothetical protein